MDEPVDSRITNYRLTPKVAEVRIWKLAENSSNITWGTHALERMNEREIFDVDVLRVLRRGMVLEQPEETPSGEWKCKAVLRLRGNRDAGVVVIILKRGRLFVKTVEWEDLR